MFRLIYYFVIPPRPCAEYLVDFSLYYSPVIMNIFVARLNFKTKSEDLEAAFAKFGQVSSAKIVKDRDTGRSKGFGFVEMPNDEEGNRAIAGLNETDLD